MIAAISNTVTEVMAGACSHSAKATSRVASVTPRNPRIAGLPLSVSSVTILSVSLPASSRIFTFSMGLYWIHGIHKTDDGAFIPVMRVDKRVQFTSAGARSQYTVVKLYGC